jgi:hypothetical protein
MKRYEFSITRQNRIEATEWQNGDWVKAEEALNRISELTAERDEYRDASLARGVNIAKLEQQRDEARDLVKRVITREGMQLWFPMILTEAVKRWEGEK